jgi:hypothetical protein
LNTASILKTAALWTAITVLVGGGWAMADRLGVRPVTVHEFLQMAQSQADVLQQLQSTQQQSVESIDWLKFNMLMERSKIAPLSPDDKRQLCTLAGQFNMNKEAGC